MPTPSVVPKAPSASDFATRTESKRRPVEPQWPDRVATRYLAPPNVPAPGRGLISRLCCRPPAALLFKDADGARQHLWTIAPVKQKALRGTWKADAGGGMIQRLHLAYRKYCGTLKALGIEHTPDLQMFNLKGAHESRYTQALSAHAQRVEGFGHRPVTRDELMLFVVLSGQRGGAMDATLVMEHEALYQIETGRYPRHGARTTDSLYHLDLAAFQRVRAWISFIDPAVGYPAFPIDGDMSQLAPISADAFGDLPQLVFADSSETAAAAPYLRARTQLPAKSQVTFKDLLAALEAEQAQVTNGTSKKADVIGCTVSGMSHYDNLRTRLGQIMLGTPFDEMEAYVREHGRMTLADLNAKFRPLTTY